MAASSPRQPNASPGRSAAPSRGKTSTPARSRTDRSVATPAPRRRRDLVAVALSVAGEVLVTLGVLLALMVAWQLWWTDIGAHHHQQEIVEALPWAVPPIVVPEASEPSSDGATTPVYLVVPGNEKRVSEAPPDEPRPSDAETFATLYVPRWGYDYVRPISEGVDRRTVLDRLGIGHYPETGLPGAWGNFAIAGHRTTFGKPFAEIESLKVGDALVVRTESRWYVYRVTGTDIVSPRYVDALAAVPGEPSAEPDGRYITLTTCHPRFSARQRYVVYGELDYWADADAGYPPELVPPGAITIDDPGALGALDEGGTG